MNFCSFCGAGRRCVGKLITPEDQAFRGRVFICETCVDMAAELVAAARASGELPARAPMAEPAP